MPWIMRPGGVRVHVGDFHEPGELELAPYRYTATPSEQRPHRTCGKPGSGRQGHSRHGTPMCSDCRRAENEYSAARRNQQKSGVA